MDFFVRDGAATATENSDVTSASRCELLDHVSEVFNVTALIGGDGDSVGIFLDGSIYDIVHCTVVSQMNDFGPTSLQNPPHDVDCRVMPIK